MRMFRGSRDAPPPVPAAGPPAAPRPVHPRHQEAVERPAARPALPPAEGRRLPPAATPGPAARAAAKRLVKQRFARLLLVVVAASVVSPLVNSASPARAFVVASGSMEPLIPTGSIVMVREGEVAVGDVVVYWSPVGAHQVHRVIRADLRPDGSYHYLTRGDANGAADSFIVPDSAVVGVVQRHVPHVGWLWMLPPAAQLLAFAAGIAAYVGITLWDARTLFRPRSAATTGVLLVLVLLVPAAGASVVPLLPPAAETFGVLGATPLPHQAGTLGSATITSGDNVAQVSVGPPKLWQEVVLWGCETAGTCSLTAPALTYGTAAGSLVRINAADYAPAPAWHLEATLAAPSGQTISVILLDKTGGGTIAASEVSTTSTTATTVRSAGFTLSSDKEYQFQSKVTGLVAGGAVTMVKLVGLQEYPTSTQTQVRIAGGSETTATTYGVPGRAARWVYEGATGYDGLAGVYLEAVGQVPALQTGAGAVRLVDTGNGTEAAAVSFGTTLTSATRVRSADLSGALVTGREYEVEYQAGTGVTPKLTLHLARIVVAQASFTKTVRYVDLAPTVTTTATSFATVGHPGRYHMDTEWGGTTAYLEATLKNSGAGGTTSLRGYDNGAAAAMTGSQLDVTGTTLARQRSGALTLNSANVTYAAQLQATSGTAEARNAWLIVYQSGGKSYDHVLRTRNDVVNGCTWDFTLQHTGGSNLARMTSATVTLRGATSAAQIVVASGAVTQATGSAVSVAYGSRAEHVVASNPGSAGSTTLNADLLGTCQGTGIHTAQPISYVLD